MLQLPNRIPTYCNLDHIGHSLQLLQSCQNCLLYSCSHQRLSPASIVTVYKSLFKHSTIERCNCYLFHVSKQTLHRIGNSYKKFNKTNTEYTINHSLSVDRACLNYTFPPNLYPLPIHLSMNESVIQSVSQSINA